MRTATTLTMRAKEEAMVEVEGMEVVEVRMTAMT